MNKILPYIAIILAIGTAWGVYGFTDKPIKIVKYFPAFITLNPFQVVTITVLALIAVLLFTKPYKVFVPRSKRVNAYVEFLKKQGIETDNIAGVTGLMRSCYALNEPIPNAKGERLIINNVLKRYTVIYSNLPAAVKCIPTVASNNLNFHLVSQVYLFKVNSLKQYIYIITHDVHLPDQTVELFEFDSMPVIADLRKVVGNEMPENRLKECLSTLQDWANSKRGIYGSSGYGQTGGSIEDIKHWLYGYFPVPMSSIDYRLFLADALQLSPILDN